MPKAVVLEEIIKVLGPNRLSPQESNHLADRVVKRIADINRAAALAAVATVKQSLEDARDVSKAKEGKEDKA